MLRQHPDIADVAVIAAPDARMGEVVMACVVARPGAAPSIASIGDYFRTLGVARHKTPERLMLVEELPRNASGKVLKHVLRSLDSARG